LTNNWSDIILQNTLQPETIEEAVEQLRTVLEDRHKMHLSILKEDDLLIGLGVSIRNAFV
jgi:hypothetical protein